MKRQLWPYLSSLSDSVDGPWILLGDFNCILDSSERFGVLLFRTVVVSGFANFCLIVLCKIWRHMVLDLLGIGEVCRNGLIKLFVTMIGNPLRLLD